MDTELDFVIPLKKNNVILRTVVEGIVTFYSPRTIYIITDPLSILEIKEHSLFWKKGKTEIYTIDENLFEKEDLERKYTRIDETSREFGWWFQQIIKLDAINRIPEISDPFVVWDADVIPLLKWDIYNLETREYKFAILQETAKNEFNRVEYRNSIYALLGLETVEPLEKGTFVPHHFVFHHIVINTLLERLNKGSILKWQEKIMSLSITYYRFSEYKCVATYMYHYFPDLLKYYPFNEYGEKGIRYRDSLEIQRKIKEKCQIEIYGLSYDVFRLFVNNEFGNNELSYLQIEHVADNSS
jgi:hypothetical protein